MIIVQCYPLILGSGGVFTFLDTRSSISSELVLRHIRILSGRKPDVLLAPSLLEDVMDSDPLSNNSLVSQW